MELPVRRSRTVPLAQVGAIGLEDADPGIVVLDDIDIAFVVHCDPMRSVELALSTTHLTHRADEFPLCVENLHPCIVPFAHIDLAVRGHMDAGHFVELAVAAAVVAELADEVAVLIEDLDAVVVAVCDIEIPVRPQRRIVGMPELTRLHEAFHFLRQIPAILRHALGARWSGCEECDHYSHIQVTEDGVCFHE